MTYELTRYCGGIDAAQDRPRGRLASIQAPQRGGLDELTQQSPPAPQSAGPKLGINAGIDALIDAAPVSLVGVGR